MQLYHNAELQPMPGVVVECLFAWALFLQTYYFSRPLLLLTKDSRPQ